MFLRRSCSCRRRRSDPSVKTPALSAIDQRTAWQQRLQAQLFHQGVPAGLRLRTRAGREALATAELSPAGRELVALALRMIETIDRELAPLDRELRSFARRQPGCRALMARLYGVGPVSATAILAELGDARRFGRSDDAVRHSGLDVTVYQSNDKRAPGHLSHEGPELLRWALFEAALSATRAGSPDHGYYLQVAERIDHNRACLSVARKLCRRAYHILRELGDEALAAGRGGDRCCRLTITPTPTRACPSSRRSFAARSRTEPAARATTAWTASKDRAAASTLLRGSPPIDHLVAGRLSVHLGKAGRPARIKTAPRGFPEERPMR